MSSDRGFHGRCITQKRHMTYKVSGIYKIENGVTHKVYVGSGVSVHNRWSNHKAGLVYGNHCNRKLQNAWNKYGAPAFRFEILEECALADLVEREQYWIDYFDAVRKGYNLQPRARSALGFRHSAKTRRRMSAVAAKVSSSPKARKERSERAKRQHATGKLGRATWSAAVREKAHQKMVATAKRNAEKSGERFRQYWSDPEARAKQSKKLAAFTGSRPEEMARRAKVFWDRMSPEERKARAALILEKRKVKHAESMRRWVARKSQKKRNVPRYVRIDNRIPDGCFF